MNSLGLEIPATETDGSVRCIFQYNIEMDS